MVPVLALVAISMLVTRDDRPEPAAPSLLILMIGALILGVAALLALCLRAKEWRGRPEKALRLKIGKVLVPVLVATMFAVAWMLLH